jgi:prophage regulatory protein
MKTQVIRFPDLNKKLGGVSRSTVFRWVRDKQFPKPINLGKNSVGWLEEQVEAWLESRTQGEQS